MSTISNLNISVHQPGNYNFAERINLNELMQQHLLKIQLEKKISPIIRSEQLPGIEANRTAIGYVLETVIRIIFSYPPVGRKSFLYINCDEENKGTLDIDLTNGFKRYIISFHTNVNSVGSLNTLHQKAIDECTSILKKYGASFTANEIRSAGCLFSISLLGKM